MTIATLPANCAVRPAKLDDGQAVTALCNAHEMAVGGTMDSTIDDVLSNWQRPSFDIATQTVLVHRGDELVGFAEMLVGRAFAVVHPESWGRGIGSWLARWLEDLSRREGRPLVSQTVHDDAAAARTLLTANGYEPRWESWIFRRMLDDAPPPPRIPEGYRITRMQPGEERLAHPVITTAFAEWPDSGPEPSFEDWHAGNVDRADVDRDNLLLAWHGDQVVGALIGHMFDDGDLLEGWTEQLAVAREHRGKGVAAALLRTMFSNCHANGYDAAGLATDSRTGARALYERVGMRIVQSNTRYAKPL